MRVYELKDYEPNLKLDYPESLVERYSQMDYEEQKKYIYRLPFKVKPKDYNEVWGMEYWTREKTLEDYERIGYAEGIVVDRGIIVGMIVNPKLTLYIYKTYYRSFGCDNNGAGYKSREEEFTLCYLPSFLILGNTKKFRALVPEGTKKLYPYAFYYGYHVELLPLPESLEIISKEAFRYSTLTNIRIPKNVIEIGENAFYKECVIFVYRDSYAHKWAIEHNQPHQIID